VKAKGYGVHLDGARLANAVAAGFDLKSVAKMGVDILVMGGTKAGSTPTEAVVFLNKITPAAWTPASSTPASWSPRAASWPPRGWACWARRRRPDPGRPRGPRQRHGPQSWPP
jgi:hypothetical protein